MNCTLLEGAVLKHPKTTHMATEETPTFEMFRVNSAQILNVKLLLGPLDFQVPFIRMTKMVFQQDKQQWMERWRGTSVKSFASAYSSFTIPNLRKRYK